MPQFERASIEHLVYKPERSWNYELGAHISLFDHTLQADGAIYMMNVSEQQVARFTPSGLGRMMTNAGESRSYGAELSLHTRPIEPLNIIASYGYTHATFTHYDAGEEEDYSGFRIPFVPKHTAALCASYTIGVRHHPWISSVTLGADATATGKIYWNESNTMMQPFYATLGASASIDTDFGILRLIVSDTEVACKILSDEGCLIKTTDVVGVKIGDAPGKLSKALEVLDRAQINMEYLYAFMTRTEKHAYVVLRVADNAKAEKALEDAGFHMITDADIDKL
mgnify:CR=1 FL=1